MPSGNARNINTARHVSIGAFASPNGRGAVSRNACAVRASTAAPMFLEVVRYRSPLGTNSTGVRPGPKRLKR